MDTSAKGAEALRDRLKSEMKSKSDIIRAEAEYCIGWPYVFASNGEMCTPEWRRGRIPYCREQKYADAIRDTCPVLSGKQSSCDGCKWAGCRCFDCQGFVHWLLEQAGVPLYGGGATTQWNTASNWAAKGESSTMPPGLVCCVYKRKEDKMSHVGMSMGDGNGGVIHCSTTVKRGNIHTDRPAWTHWAIPKGLYSTEELRKAGIDVPEDENMPTLRRGSRGEQVAQLQALLNDKTGTDLTVDGVFGAKTEATVKAFQREHGLYADGIVGPKTREALGIQDEHSDFQAKSDDLDVWNTLYQAIKNAHGVAGLMGNLQAESGINAENLQNTGERALGMTDSQYTKAVDDGSYTNFANDNFGYGIAQWTYSSRKKNLLNYAKKANTSIGDMAMQLSFLLDELRFEYSSVWYALLNAISVKEASDAVMLKFERPKNQSEENLKRRAEFGQRFYDKYAITEEHQEPKPTELDELRARVAKLENQVNYLLDLSQSK